MEYKILSCSQPTTLTKMVQSHIDDNWTPVGGHKVVERSRQERYSGSQHMGTIIAVEYSQTMVR